MKNLTNAKKFLVMVIMLVVMLVSTSVFAADEGWASLDNVLTNSTNGTSTSGGNSTLSTSGSLNGTTTGNTTLNGTSNGTTTGNSLSTGNSTGTTLNVASPTNNTATTTNNSSSYTNNTKNLPDTGLKDSIPMVAVVLALVVSAVYAYKKVRDYQNL